MKKEKMKQLWLAIFSAPLSMAIMLPAACAEDTPAQGSHAGENGRSLTDVNRELSFGQEWNIQVNFSPVILKLIESPLFLVKRQTGPFTHSCEHCFIGWLRP